MNIFYVCLISIIINLCLIYLYNKYGLDFLKKLYITKYTIHKSNIYNSNSRLFKVCVFNSNDRKKSHTFLNKILVLHKQIGYENNYSNISFYEIDNKVIDQILFDYANEYVSDKIINIAYYNVFHNYRIPQVKLQDLKKYYNHYSKTQYIKHICLLNRIPWILTDDNSIQIGWGINQLNTNELFMSTYTTNKIKNNGRIPIISTTGTNGKTTTTTLCAFILRGLYKNVGKTTTTGIYINDNKIDSGDCAGSESARTLLMNKCIGACSFETSLGGIRNGGLIYEYANVGILTNIGNGDHISPRCVCKSIEDIITTKMTVINYILPDGYAVINADDKHLNNILSRLIHKNIFLFSMSRQNTNIVKSINDGYPVIFYESPNIVYLYNKHEILFNIKDIPILQEAPLFQIENVMASIAAACALNIPENIIKKQLLLYENTCANNPGRMNKIRYGRSDIIIDYAHNTDSVNNICKYFSSLQKYTKKIVMFGAAGDRDDDVIKNMTNTLYDAFDITILFVDEKTLRGRKSIELLNLMKDGIDIHEKNHSKRVKEHHGEKNAINESFEFISKNNTDLLLLLVDDVEGSIQYIMKTFIEK